MIFLKKHHSRKGLMLPLKTLLLLSVFSPVSVFAQTADQNSDADQFDELEEIVVTGTRASQLRAIERKRSGASIRDVVSSDLVGKLPDFNAAEAIQRLPGLSVEIDQGEGRYPVVRGIDSNLNNVTIDGNSVAAPEADGRRVSLDVIPSDLISAIEVVKAITPDMEGNAVGGGINVVTHSAFDRKDDFLFASAQAGYNEKSGNVPYGGSLVYGTRFGQDENFGIVVAASYFTRQFETNLIEGINWSDVDDSGVFAPDSIRIFRYDIERIRWGVNVNLDYRPTDETKFYVKTFFNEFTDNEARDQLDFNIQRGDATINSPTSVSFSGGRAKREYRQNNQTQQLLNISPGFETNLGAVTWGASYVFAHAEEITPLRNDWEFRSPSNIASTIDLSNLFFQLDADPLLNDPNNFGFRRFLTRTEFINEDIHSFRSDLSYETDVNDVNVTFTGGFKYTNRQKTRDRSRSRFNDTNGFTLGDNNLSLPDPGGLFDGRFDLGPIVNFDAAEAFFAANPGEFELDVESTVGNEFDIDYGVKEEVLAGYLMASADIGALNVLGGLRVERTESNYTAFSIRDADGDGDLELEDITPTAGDQEYTNWMPSIHLKYAVQEDITIRAAWTNTIGRPNYESVVPIFEEEDSEASAGNPNLLPFESMGLDLSIEYYFQDTGIFSVGVFYKDIKNPIFNRKTTDVIFNGLLLDELNQPENADSGELFGIEVNLQLQFESLPAPFDGFGASANATFVDSSVDVIGRENDDLSFIRQSDYLYNAALFYAKGPFEARVAVTFRDDYLEAIGSDTDGDSYFDARAQWDFKMSYNVSDRFTVFGQMQNFTDSSRREYQGISSRLLADEAYSWTAMFGINANF